MKRIAVDMDEVIADFIPKHLAVFNRVYSEQIRIEDLQGKHLKDLRPHLGKEILDLIREPSFFRDLEPMKDSQRVLKKLSQTHEVFIATAAMEFPTSLMAKHEWLGEFFPFIPEKHYVFCGDKTIVHADYLIDDNARHFERFCGRGILYSAPHNLGVTGYDRVATWAEVEAYFG
jgi:5'(3')-deoxyribonucleotidase